MFCTNLNCIRRHVKVNVPQTSLTIERKKQNERNEITVTWNDLLEENLHDE